MVSLLVLAGVAAASAAAVTGRVIDPQALAVRGARVELVCDSQLTSATTDDAGRFSLPAAPAGTTCTLSVTREGFARMTRTIRTGADGELTLQLRLAVVREVVSVVANSPPEFAQPIGSALLDGEQLWQLFGRTEDMIRYAGLFGGSAANGTSVYVDGLPLTVMPPPDVVGQISVNAGPFSAEYGDGDVTRIQIITRPAARRLRVSPGGSFLGFGGGDALRDGLHAESSSGSIAASGGVPRLPITFSGGLQATRSERELAFEAVRPLGVTDTFAFSIPSDRVAYSNRTRSGTISGFYTSGRMRAHIAYSGSRSRISNVGVGGLVLPEAGLATTGSSDGVHASVNSIRGQLAFENGFVARTIRSSSVANSSEQGLSVAGSFVAGGALMTAQRSNRLTWSAKHVTRTSSSRPWIAGVEVGGSSQSSHHTPNPLGVFEFENAQTFASAMTGALTGTLSVLTGETAIRYDGLTVSPFVQKTLMRTNRVQIDGGVRVEHQSQIGTFWSPRIWAATEWRRFVIQGGGGLFTTFVPDTVFVNAIMKDGDHVQYHVTTGAVPANPQTILSATDVVRAVLAPGLRDARATIGRVAVARPFGYFAPSIEYSASRDVHRLGSDRSKTADGWIDLIESNRSASRQQVKARLGYVHNGKSVTAQYEFLRAFDDTDGPFSYPERQGLFASEWARSTGLAPHAVTVASMLTFSRQIVAGITDTWQGRSPYDITAGVDSDQNGIFNERGGRVRNSGMLPSQHVLSVHASRRFTIPFIDERLGTRIRLNVAMHLDNLTGARNYTSVGSVAGSATFGMPLSAAPGRTARVSISLD